ncbi:hypothetical protein O3M35_008722 [Rhynocoris fuscipes]|uniref:Uncharacterized protein n=1 Tax=Rhynocoris fuscipes TaxID=488301 RepID=A0AAW1D7A2_9HEMI
MVYSSKFQASASYGIMFWGNSYSANKIFCLQKRAVRIIVETVQSATHLFTSILLIRFFKIIRKPFLSKVKMATPPWKTQLNRWNSSSHYDCSVAKEYDDFVRPADLWLYCSPVAGSSGTNDRPTTLYQQARTGEPLYQYSHWILVFKYRDKTIAAIDGNNENDKLEPSYWKSIDDSWREVKFITTLDISPKEVREIAVAHPMNGQDYFLWGIIFTVKIKMATTPWKTFSCRRNPSSRYESLIVGEDDDCVRPADLWLYCSPVGGSAEYKADAMNAEDSQWILVFKFQDGQIRAIDGENKNERLMPSYWKDIDISWTEVLYISTLNISPKQIREIAVGHPMNGDAYSEWTSNCYNWANHVLKHLGLPLVTNYGGELWLIEEDD